MSLKLADKYVKDGDYKAALDAIAQARKLDPTNPYAIAYEERVRSLLNAQQNAGHAQSSNPKDSPPLDQELEQISRLAMQQNRASAEAGPKTPMHRVF